jgi:hypothetical protein
MTVFSFLLLGLLASLVLAVSAGVVQLGRQARAAEATAEAVGTLADSVLADALSEARRVLEAEEGETTKPDHPMPDVRCRSCGQMKPLCRCYPAT